MCALASFVFPARPLAAPWWLLSGHPLLCVSRFSSLPLGARFSFAPPLSLAFAGFRPRVPWALALCAVCFFCLPLLGSLCALASFCVCRLAVGCSPVFAAPPPPHPLLCLAVFAAATRRSVFFFVVRPGCLCRFPVSSPGCPRPWRCVLFVPRAAGCGVLCFALSCVPSRFPAVCGAFCAVPGVVWCACVWLGSCPVLCWVLLCCFCCALLSCVAVFSVGCCCFFALFLAFPWCSGLFRFVCSACALRCRCACGVALCALLSCPCGAGWCFVLLSVVFACLLLGLAVLCCLLLGLGESWCRVSVVCCGVFLGAVLPRVAACRAAWHCVVVRCVVSFSSALCCRALCRVLGRCPSSCGPVPSALCFVLSRRAVCVLLWCVAAWCCSQLCFVPCASWGVVLCVPYPLRPVRCCCASLLSLGALPPCAVPRGAVLPCGVVVSCPAAVFVWFLLLVKQLQNLF